jgi:hypothetical protein
MQTHDWLTTLEVIDAAQWAGILFPDLPYVAAELLAAGADSPALRGLAGADLEPADPRDFRDAFLSLLDEQAIPEPPVERRVQLAAQLLAVVVASRRIGLKEGVRRLSRLVVATRYPSNPDLMALYGLSDEWGAGWGSPTAALEEEARETFERLARQAPPPRVSAPPTRPSPASSEPASTFRLLIVFMRKRARFRKAPTGSQEVVLAHPSQVDDTIKYWGKLGYDLHDQSEVDTPGSRRTGQMDLPVRLMKLTFVKK